MGKIIQDKNVGMALLCDNAPYTLAMSLSSYERSGLYNCVDASCVVYPDGADKVAQVAAERGLPSVSSALDAGFIGELYKAVSTLDTDYILLVEDDCLVWEHLKGEDLEREFRLALELLVSGQADMVRLRHAWRGNKRKKSAYTYSYYHSVQQLSSRWLHPEALSDAPDWVKSLRRKLHPYRAKRSIGRSVYVEENPHEIYPEYIRKIDEGYIIDSAVFQWTNQPTLIARETLRKILLSLRATNKSIGPLSEDFEYAVNNIKWRSAHMNIGVVRGIFT